MRKFLLGFKYAFQGVRYAFATQINLKFHSFAGLAVILLGWGVGLSRFEWLWISAAMGLVLVAELFNTALEVLVDLVSPGFHPKAGIIKDLASAAVLLTAVLAFVIGLFVFLPHLL
ncbi:diacylglycerol kinase family protein [Pedobacter sp. SYSU D00535]|uniref:diacylglycerol kinase family protein n=1 Tax=Pedobacter sp. SYSU D00535 TaxID=2810308 RepID=UPI001A96CC4F|nr:diacylglycerol kinase family protein [Pedobacter sp. SYSU D00535]